MFLKWSLVILVIVLQVHRTQSINFLKLAQKVGSKVKNKITPTTPPPEPEKGSVLKSFFRSMKKIPKKMLKKAKETMAQEAIKHTFKKMIGKGGDSDENEVQKKDKGFVKKMGKMAKAFF